MELDTLSLLEGSGTFCFMGELIIIMFLRPLVVPPPLRLGRDGIGALRAAHSVRTWNFIVDRGTDGVEVRSLVLKCLGQRSG